MIRTLNFTGRRRIPRESARITLRLDAAGMVEFDAELELGALDLPSDAKIYIEAAFKTTFMRFEWGTVAQPVPADDRRLARLAQPALAHFRVKVVEPAASGPGRLLAVADHIAPEGLLAGEKRRVPLFRVNYTTALVDEIWRLVLDDGGPILDLQQIAGIKEVTRQEAFMALVFPQVVRLILMRIFADGMDDASADPYSWQARWLRFGEKLCVEAPPPLLGGKPEAAHDEWIDSVVKAWSRRQKLVANFKKRFDSTEAALP